MALFPHLEFDNKVQVNDKIRLNGRNSFAATGTTAISTMTLAPASDVSAVNIYNADLNLRYLDWAYDSFKMDIDSVNNFIDFKEGGNSFIATLTTGSYSLDDLATEIQIQMSAEGANIYTVSVSDDDKLTIAADGSFDLIPSSQNILGQLGYKTTSSISLTNSASYTGRRIRYMTRKITISIGNGTTTADLSDYIKVYSKDGDNLFSSDVDLLAHEPDIMSWLPKDRSSYKFAHRRSQELILAFLDEKGYTDIFGDKLLIDAIVDITEVAEWSKFLTLKLIFQGIKNAVDDVFGQKADTYLALEKNARNRVILRLDKDNDGLVEANSSEGVMISTINCARR